MKKAIITVVAIVSIIAVGCATNNNASSTKISIEESKEETTAIAAPTKEDIEEVAIKAVKKQLNAGHLMREDGSQSEYTIDLLIDPESCAIRASDIERDENDCWLVAGIVGLYDKHGNNRHVWDDGTGPSRLAFAVTVQDNLSAKCIYLNY